MSPHIIHVLGVVCAAVVAGLVLGVALGYLTLAIWPPKPAPDWWCEQCGDWTDAPAARCARCGELARERGK